MRRMFALAFSAAAHADLFDRIRKKADEAAEAIRDERSLENLTTPSTKEGE
jgi:hypothetical protein